MLLNSSNFWKFYKLPKLVKRVNCVDLDYEIKINKEDLLATLYYLKVDSYSKYKVLTDIVVYDRPTKKNRFTIIYNLLSKAYNNRLRVFTTISALQQLKTTSLLFNSANWLEREAWDMFGIFFLNHPDLRRILTDYNFKGYPLRKDYPVSGFSEVMYSDRIKRIKYVPVQLSQEHREYFYN